MKLPKPKIRIVEFINDEWSCKYCGEESCQSNWLVNGKKKSLFECQPHINAKLREKLDE